MFGIIGTVPEKDFPLTFGQVSLSGDQVLIGDKSIAINRGTPAMIAAAAKTLNYMDQPNPFCYLVGDIGDGDGCRLLYRHLIDHIAGTPFKTLTFHYFQPEVDLFKQLLVQIKGMSVRPTLIADAGFMYVAKMGGEARSFDLFTPDAGELAYLADEQAPHPFYTRGFILHDENLVPDLVERAYRHNNASTYLLVKGVKDFVAKQDGIIAEIDSPSVEALEAIGGTGDTLTGIVSALIVAGMEMEAACIKAARANRVAGFLAQPTPAAQVYEVIQQIPLALDKVLKDG